jgi:uncharacterized surface protein with fasciclin (FAS1) repeats
MNANSRALVDLNNGQPTHHMFKQPLILICIAMIGCSPKPATMDTSQRINAGVNIVPTAVLAAEKEVPSKKPASGDVDLIDVISDSDEPHYKLIEVLRESGLVPLLQEQGPYTILAPTDDAFAKLPPGVLDRLLLPSHHTDLVNFVNFHLLKGRITESEMIQTNGQVPTLAGPSIVIKGTGSKVMVQDANVIRSDSAASNGAVHWIDTVLIPPT